MDKNEDSRPVASLQDETGSTANVDNKTLNVDAMYIMNSVGVDAVLTRYVKLDMDMVAHITTIYDQFMPGEALQMKTYFKRRKNGNMIEEKSVVCKKSKSSGEVYGRIYPVGGMGLAALPSDVRNAVARKYYKDIDMKNAHASFLLQKALKSRCPCPLLEEYVTSREAIFADFQEEGYDRDIVKRSFTAVLFQGNPRLLSSSRNAEWVVALRDEVRGIGLYFAERDPKTYAKCKKENPSNPMGCYINRICVEVERPCLLAMDAFFNAVGRGGLASFIHDGGLVASPESEPDFPMELLRKCEAWVFDQTGYKVELVEKKMTTGIVLSKGVSSNSKYSVMKQEFERHHFKCISTSMFHDTEFNIIRDVQKLKTAFQHMVYLEIDSEMKEKKVSFITEWLSDPTMRTYQFVELLPPPRVCPLNTYNLWNGFDIERTPSPSATDDFKDDVATLTQHLMNLCDNDEAVFTYCFKWIACLFQKPGYKNNVALLFKTLEGAGKDLLFVMLKNMIGDRYCLVTSQIERDIFGNFNGVLSRKLLVAMNEMSGAIGFRYSDRLKDLITTEYDMINNKGVEMYQTPSYCHYMFFTNNNFPVKVDLHERRTMAIQSLNAVPEKSYFDRLLTAIHNRNALRLLYDSFMNTDLTDFDWRNDRPITSFYEDIREVSLDKELAFLAKWVTSEYHKTNGGLVTRDAKKLYDDFYSTLGESYSTNPVKFGIKLKNYNIEGVKSVKSHGIMKYEVDTKVTVESLIAKGALRRDWLT